MMSERHQFDRLLERLSDVMRRIGKLEPFPYDFGTEIPLFRSEIHSLAAIGATPGINVTQLAQALEVSKGAASQTVRKLVKKGLVEKTRAVDNDKEIRLLLTELGCVAFTHHERMHAAMYDVVREYFGPRFDAHTENLLSTLDELSGLLDHFEKRMPEKMTQP